MNKNEYLNYYIRYIKKNKDKNVEVYEKRNKNLLETNQENEWKTLYYFKKGYKPIVEEHYYRNGSLYTFTIIHIDNNDLLLKVNELIEFITKNDKIAGIVFKSRINKGKKIIKCEIWSLTNIRENNIIKQIKQIFYENKKNKVEFSLFFPHHINGDETLTSVFMRNKKVYLLRFDPNLTHKMYFIKTWWEIFMLSYLKKYYRPNSNVIDIGGNVGTHTLLLSEIISKNNKVHVFEPVYGDIIKKNVIENKIENKVMIYNEAVGKVNKTITIDTYPRNCCINFGRFSLVSSINTNIMNELSNETKEKCKKIPKKVNIVTLDSKNITNVSLLKIDVEGMELDVLEGAYKTIEREKPVIFMEIWKSKKNETLNTPIMQKLLNTLKYKMVFIEEGYYGDDYLFLPPTQN
jgi:FkbM family methyltransferase